MSYTIDERNPERQQLLAKVLDPPTRTVLAYVPRRPGSVLDVGCGQANTTRLLADVLEANECIGFEFDASLDEVLPQLYRTSVCRNKSPRRIPQNLGGVI